MPKNGKLGGKARLTERFVSAARARGGFARYTDDGPHAIRGLHVVVRKPGCASYVLRIKDPTRAPRANGAPAYPVDITIGDAAVCTLSDAREMAREAKRRARNGESPKPAKRAARVVPSFAEVAAEVIAEKATLADGGAEWESTLRAYAFPRIGAKSVAEIDANDVRGVLMEIWHSKHETAKRLRTRIKAVFARAIFKKLRVDNPADNLDGVLPPVRKQDEHHEALAHGEVSGVLAHVRASRSRASIKAVFQFIALTAVRAGEALRAEWSEIDMDAREWRIPAARMKAGREHVVPLSGRAIEILGEMAALREGVLIFPGAKSGKPVSTMTLRDLVKGMKGSTGKQITIHGLRASFRNWCAETGKPRELAERALAHEVGNRIEAAYNRSTLLETRRTLMDEWAAYLST